MQCHVILLQTTGTAYAREHPRHIERDRKTKLQRQKCKYEGKNRTKGGGKKMIKIEKIGETNTPKNTTNSKRRLKRGRKNGPSVSQGGYAAKSWPPPDEMRQAYHKDRRHHQEQAHHPPMRGTRHLS